MAVAGQPTPVDRQPTAVTRRLALCGGSSVPEAGRFSLFFRSQGRPCIVVGANKTTGCARPRPTQHRLHSGTPPLPSPEQRPCESNSRCCVRNFGDHVLLCPPPPFSLPLPLSLSLSLSFFTVPFMGMLTQCKLLYVGNYLNPSFGPFSPVGCSIRDVFTLLVH